MTADPEPDDFPVAPPAGHAAADPGRFVRELTRLGTQADALDRRLDRLAEERTPAGVPLLLGGPVSRRGVRAGGPGQPEAEYQTGQGIVCHDPSSGTDARQERNTEVARWRGRRQSSFLLVPTLRVGMKGGTLRVP